MKDKKKMKIQASKELYPEVENYIRKHFSEDDYRWKIADCSFGDVQIVYVHCIDNPYKSKIINYNSWYPGEIAVQNLGKPKFYNCK